MTQFSVARTFWPLFGRIFESKDVSNSCPDPLAQSQSQNFISRPTVKTEGKETSLRREHRKSHFEVAVKAGRQDLMELSKGDFFLLIFSFWPKHHFLEAKSDTSVMQKLVEYSSGTLFIMFLFGESFWGLIIGGFAYL